MSVQPHRRSAYGGSPEVLEYFRLHPIFGVLPKDAFADLLGSVTERTYQKRHYIYYAGDPIGPVIAVKSGLIALMRVKSSDARQVVVTFGPGDVFGTTSSSLGFERTCAAIAVLRSTVFLIPQEKFVSIYQEFPKVAFHLIQELHRTLVRSQDTILRFTITPVVARVASFLLDTASGRQRDRDDVRFDLSLSRVDLAFLLGTTRESITRVLNRLCRERVITVKGHTVSIVDMDALRQLAA